MKGFCFLLLTAASGFAADIDFATGQAARLFIGQKQATQQEPGASDTLLGAVGGMAFAADTLFVADSTRVPSEPINNRVLIYRNVSANLPKPSDELLYTQRCPICVGKADTVLGQPDFSKTDIGKGPSGMRRPTAVASDGTVLAVADTDNNRVLIWKSLPTTNAQPADVVLGQKDFDGTGTLNPPTATSLRGPQGLWIQNGMLFVADTQDHRVLVWRTIPSANGAAADYVIGQPNFTTFVEPDLTQSKLVANAATLLNPVSVTSDGVKLYVTDLGHNRVLIWNSIPSSSGAPADVVVGQPNMSINQASDAADSMRTPIALAWDGTNLYVSDTFNRRINVYSMGEHNIPYTGVRNAASVEIYAVGSVIFSGTTQENDSVTIKIVDKDYTYKIGKNDSLQKIIDSLVALINAGEGDPHVFAAPNYAIGAVAITARAGGSLGNEVTYSATTKAAKSTDTPLITATAAGANLAGGMDAAKIAPGTVVSILGDHLSDGIESAPLDAQKLPDTLADTQVYFDGVRAPLMFVSPTQINAQIPFEFLDTTSINAYVRTVRRNGTISVTTPVAVTIVQQNPGIFAMSGQDPRPAVVLHYSSYATGTISVDGSAKAGDIAKVAIEDRQYSYTVVDGDTLDTIRDHLIELINQDPKVRAYPAGVFDRIRLQARVAGPEGNGIPFTANAPEGQSVILTATNSALCCANVAGTPVTERNPAVPGETLVVMATGLGLPDPLDLVTTGEAWPEGAPVNKPREFVSSLAGGKTANVLYAGLKPGTVGIWEVHLELNSDLPTDPLTQMTIAQAEFVSNIVTFPLVNPNPPADTTTTP